MNILTVDDLRIGGKYSNKLDSKTTEYTYLGKNKDDLGLFSYILSGRKIFNIVALKHTQPTYFLDGYVGTQWRKTYNEKTLPKKWLKTF